MSAEPLTREEFRALTEAAMEEGATSCVWDAFCVATNPEPVLALLDDLQAAERRAEIAEKAMESAADQLDIFEDAHPLLTGAVAQLRTALADIRALAKRAPE